MNRQVAPGRSLFLFSLSLSLSLSLFLFLFFSFSSLSLSLSLSLHSCAKRSDGSGSKLADAQLLSMKLDIVQRKIFAQTHLYVLRKANVFNIIWLNFICISRSCRYV